MLIQRLKTFGDTALSLEELVELEVGGKALRTGFETRNVAVPAWLSDALNRIGKEIDLMQRDELEKRLREARIRKASLMTPEEKRGMVEKEIADLEKALGIEKAPA